MTNATKSNAAADAKLIREAATAWSSNADRFPRTRRQQGDSLHAAYRQDARDLRKVASTLRTQGYVAAYRLAQSMDSIVRDQIPSAVWERMHDFTVARTKSDMLREAAERMSAPVRLIRVREVHDHDLVGVPTERDLNNAWGV